MRFSLAESGSRLSSQLKTYHLDLLKSDRPYWEMQVETVIHAVNRGMIPHAQYGALMIDEGHDFAASWLKLVVQMVDYDDAQSIYKERKGLGCSLSSVGVKAKGRTTILRLNYRNTREILRFAYRFAQHYINLQNADDDRVPLIEPEAAGDSGPEPEIHRLDSFAAELNYMVRCLQQWHKEGVGWGDMAVLYIGGWQGEELHRAVKNGGIPCLWLASKAYKSAYDPSENCVHILTVHSSKGLEFSRVVIVGVGHMADQKDAVKKARLLYVGMTRAQTGLVMTTSQDNVFSLRLLEACAA